MAKRLLSIWTLICAAILLMPSALAAASNNDGTTLPEIQVADADFSNQVCSFQLHLSIAEMKGTVLSVNVNIGI